MKDFAMILWAVAVLLGATAFSQEPSEPAAEEKPEQPRQIVIRVFNETSPEIGQPLPAVACFDETGERFQLRQLKGQYSVLMFGCLT
jgi:cytochrome oxidase Cu insertion factor (SCO1/SenC/PrrC family)